MPLTMRQISDQRQDDSGPRVETTTISITSDVLDFLGYKGGPKKQQEKFSELLDRADIPNKQVKYDDEDADEHVKEDGLQLTEYHRQVKQWINMGIDDFKDSIMRLNTKRAKEIRLYYRNLESATCLLSRTKHTKRTYGQRSCNSTKPWNS